MRSILYQNLNPKANLKFKRFPNTPQGLQELGELILDMHYRPWLNMHAQNHHEDLSFFFFTMIQKDGLDFLKHDEVFFLYRLTLVDVED